ncbi:MAG: hypothetical protein HC783_16135 [Rhodobacteraceae bacterium]|nr:hypothetical protein [Paracoccaceae bacterium]
MGLFPDLEACHPWGMTRHAPIPLDPDPPRPDPRAPDVVRLRQGVRAGFRAVVGEVPVILRVEVGHKVIRGAVEAAVPAGI